MLVHPVSRILSFLILVIFLASMHLPGLLLLGVLFFIFALADFKNHLVVISRFVWRLRWFWLSILLLYSLLPLEVGNESSLDTPAWLMGLMTGLLRCLSLLLVIMYFVLLIHPIPLDQLQQAWAWLMRPLRVVGIRPEIVSLRIALTFHAVREFQSLNLRADQQLSLRELPERLFAFLQLAIEKSYADNRDLTVTFQLLQLPGIAQWLGLIGLLVALSILQIVW